MNVLSALNSYFQPQVVAPRVLAQGLSGEASRRGPSWPTAQGGDVALSDAGQALARQSVGDASSLWQRASDVGSATIDAAKKFVASFAESLFGDAAKGMSLSFETSSVSASSSFSAALLHGQDSDGSSDSAALRLADAADFVGKGTITTADGHRFRFEVEVHYESTLEMSASASSTTTAAKSDGDAAPVRHRPTATREGLAAHFPGSVADLFKTFEQGALNLFFQGRENDDQGASSKLGRLELRLLNRLANPDATAGKLANKYGDFPASGKVAEKI